MDISFQIKEVAVSLLRAAESGDVDVVSYLLENYDIKNTLCSAALMLAAKNGHIAVVREVLPVASINAKDIDGSTALMLAAEYGHAAVVEALLGIANIDISHKNNDGNTALMLASKCSHDINTVKLLVSRLTRLEVRFFNNNMEDAYSLAATAGIAKYLLYSGKLLLVHSNFLSDDALEIQSARWLYSSIMYANSDRVVNALTDIYFSRRVRLLGARVCEVSFSEDIVFKYAGMAMADFNTVSMLMRAAKLAKLVYGFNAYIFMRILMLRSAIAKVFARMSDDLKIYLLGFLGKDDFVFMARESLTISNLTVNPVVIAVDGSLSELESDGHNIIINFKS